MTSRPSSFGVSEDVSFQHSTLDDDDDDDDNDAAAAAAGGGGGVGVGGGFDADYPLMEVGRSFAPGGRVQCGGILALADVQDDFQRRSLLIMYIHQVSFE